MEITMHFEHLFPTERKENWAPRNPRKSQSKPANFWQLVKKVDVLLRKVCSYFKNMGLDFKQV